MGTTDAEDRTEFWSTVAGLLRRKVVVIPALLVALALGALAYLGTSKTYESSTTMVLATNQYGGTESQDPSQPTQLINPMLNFNDSLRTTSAILIQSMSTSDVLEQLGATGGQTQLIVNDGRTNPELLGLNGPFLYIEGRSVSAEDAQRVVVDAQALMQEQLRKWQGALNAPEKTYVNLVAVVPPTAPQASAGRATKLAMMAFLFGFLMCLSVAYASQQIRLRRRARMPAADPVERTPPPDDASPPRVPAVQIHDEHDADDEEEGRDGDADESVAVPVLLNAKVSPRLGTGPSGPSAKTRVRSGNR